MLRVALAELRAGAVETVGEVAAGDPLLADPDQRKSYGVTKDWPPR